MTLVYYFPGQRRLPRSFAEDTMVAGELDGTLGGALEVDRVVGRIDPIASSIGGQAAVLLLRRLGAGLRPSLYFVPAPRVPRSHSGASASSRTRR